MYNMSNLPSSSHQHTRASNPTSKGDEGIALERDHHPNAVNTLITHSLRYMAICAGYSENAAKYTHLYYLTFLPVVKFKAGRHESQQPAEWRSLFFHA